MKDREKTKTIIKAAAFIMIVILIPLILFLTNREFFLQFDSIEKVENYISGYGYMSGIVYIGLQIFQVVISVIPGEIFQVAAGYLFGPYLGFLYSFAGCILGETIAFGLARLLGRGFVRLFISDHSYEKYASVLNSPKGYTLCFVLYFIPGIPKDILCYIAGASEISFLPFIILSMLGRIPGLAGSILVGSLVDSGRYITAIVILAIACVCFVLGFVYRSKISAYIEKVKKNSHKKHR